MCLKTVLVAVVTDVVGILNDVFQNLTAGCQIDLPDICIFISIRYERSEYRKQTLFQLHYSPAWGCRVKQKRKKSLLKLVALPIHIFRFLLWLCTISKTMTATITAINEIQT